MHWNTVQAIINRRREKSRVFFSIKEIKVHLQCLMPSEHFERGKDSMRIYRYCDNNSTRQSLPFLISTKQKSNASDCFHQTAAEFPTLSLRRTVRSEMSLRLRHINAFGCVGAHNESNLASTLHEGALVCMSWCLTVRMWMRWCFCYSMEAPIPIHAHTRHHHSDTVPYTPLTHARHHRKM